MKSFDIKRKGFTLIELLAVILILGIITLIAIPVVSNMIKNAKIDAFKNTAYAIVNSADLIYTKELTTDNNENLMFTYNNGNETSNVSGKKLDYSGSKPKSGNVMVNSDGEVAIAIHNGTYCAEKKYNEDNILISKKVPTDCLLFVFDGEYNISRSVNQPKLASGMTPIKWNGTEWVNTTTDDIDWYDYNEKKWANAMTADGSFWVWIPRYVYKITSGWHSNTTGNVEVKFSVGTDDTISGTIALDNGLTSDSSNNKWTNQVAFDFGTTKLTGIWVAKFEATASEGLTNNAIGDNVSTKTVKILPNVKTWRYISIGNMFQASRNMENNSVYGWGTTGNDIDTHMIKNTEWGAVAYLTKSKYGKQTDQVWINPADDFTTGCAGDSVASDGTSGCLRQYNTTNGVKASTTGNIYGIYDMVGGSWERVAAYVDNNNINLSTNGLQLINADDKYKDVYEKGLYDDQGHNYELTASRKGDAIWETSGSVDGAYSWYSDYACMPNNEFPWFGRGGDRYGSNTYTGMYFFYRSDGAVSSSEAFRPVLAVAPGL